MSEIRSILIVGGGTAGWISATYLNKALNEEGQKRVKITLIESEEVYTIGVGEATIPMFAQFFNFLGISEEAWMSACNATYKLGIKFKNWYDKSLNDHYWHTFGQMQANVGGNISIAHHWLHDYKSGKTKLPFSKAVHEVVYVCEAKKGPNKAFSQGGKLPYAYHLDAGLLVKMLKKYALANDVDHATSHVQKIAKDQNGYISSVTTKEGQELSADLYIDCTGFKSLLLGESLEVPYDSYKDYLPCDKAVAIGTMYDEEDPYNEIRGGLDPYTTAEAMDAGWSWKIPLVSRGGNGYMYSSQHKTDDEALEEFSKKLKGKGTSSDPKVMNIKTGSMQKHWAKNCVGIGMSAGFIEPMESTGLALIQIGLMQLVYRFPDKTFDPYLQKVFNEKMEGHYTNIRDFIILHYKLTKREDTPFWKMIKHDLPIPDTLAENLENWKHYWDEQTDERSMFGMYNYISILSGMNYLPAKSLPLLDHFQIDRTFNRFQAVSSRGKQLANSLGTQAEYFKQIKRIRDFQATAF